ncbi:adenylate/guanylate cyclase domain-containing protein [Leptolyngbya sp. PCC 6406]|uniref:adenylate/guanylate cyclase domain-containing protein n=1 Tax=Leptolyngbya sp. PCC 6406 TaxID=1173264 RepID=UPI0006852486|nr:adenylate/guanylate cyclase domain-containing protein [Leptolyngbya sp. PCC 6406]
MAHFGTHLPTVNFQRSLEQADGTADPRCLTFSREKDRGVTAFASSATTSMSCSTVDGPTGTLLIIDAHQETYAVLLPQLAAIGHQVQQVKSGQEALALLSSFKPDVVVLATQLPGMSGFDLCLQIRKLSHLSRIPVLFTGAGDCSADRLRAFAVGGVDFVAHPFLVEEMVARIQSHLTTARLHHRFQYQTQRALSAGGQIPLLASLQRTLHQQAQKLQDQNQKLQAEVWERQQMEKALRLEQQKSEQLLLNILPRAIVDQLKQFQGSLAERFEEATVLFADIVNFTPLAAAVSPLELVNLLNQIFSAFDLLAEKYGLEKIKTIGDAYMVVGGLPLPQPDHAQAVVQMALEMQMVIQQFSRHDGQPLQLRIGINTGDVVAGVIGIKKFSYDLWGDTVNVASRMEAQGTPGKIQVTGATYERLKEDFDFEPWGELLVKGKGYMPIYHLVGAKTSAAR